MKIGILTFWTSKDNYGQLLQAYALQKYLSNKGHDPFLIRLIESAPKYESGFKFSKIFTYIRNFNAYFHFALSKITDKKYAQTNSNHLRQFDSFLKTHLKLSEKTYTEADLFDSPPLADAYICGSDQIWGGNEIYYLPFVPKNRLKIAYAPSLGGINPFKAENAQRIKKYLSEFSFIGMREESGKILLNENGFTNATQVIDPTLLLTQESYSRSFKSKVPQNSYNEAFIYLLGSQSSCKTKDIIKFINSINYSYTYVASQGRTDKYNKSPLTIPEWINSIKNSKLVITNSFHCIVFSLIFHKEFIFIPLSGSFSRMNSRIFDLLKACQISTHDCIYNGHFKIPQIDFKKFDAYHHSQICVSTKIFNNLLIES